MNRIIVFGLGLLFIASSCSAKGQKSLPENQHDTTNRSCAAGGDRNSFVRVHGRLGLYNGGYPNLRLWHIGTHHLFGIYGDPADLNCIRGGLCGGDEDTKLPANLDALMKLPNPLFEYEFYGDFEIRLLEPFRTGHMQAACIVDAHNLVRRDVDK